MQEHVGVGVTIHKQWWGKVENVRPIDGRMVEVERKAKPPSVLYVVDAPTATHETETKEAFYDKLINEVRRSKSAHRITIIAGDFNAKLGAARNDDKRQIIGRHPYGGASVSEENQQVLENRSLFLGRVHCCGNGRHKHTVSVQRRSQGYVAIQYHR